MARAAGLGGIGAAGPVLKIVLAWGAEEGGWSYVDVIVESFQGYVFLGVIFLPYVLGGDELLERDVVVGIEQTLDDILDGVVLQCLGRFTRPLGVLQGRVRLLDVGDALDPVLFLGIPANCMAAGSFAQVKLFITVSIIRCEGV